MLNSKTYRNLFCFVFIVIQISILNNIKANDTLINYYDHSYLRYKDFVYSDNIKTVTLNKKGWDFSPAIIRLNSEDKLILRFDDLDGDLKNYYYTIIHCDAKWRPSELHPNDYIEGFYKDRIENFNHSFNKRVGFTNYFLEFPNINMKPKISGNYILKVFRDNEIPEIVLTKRFLINEEKVPISGFARRALQVSLRDSKQEVNFSINTQDFRIENPYQNITVVIKQNGRWDNTLHDIQPRTISGNILRYDQESEILFDAGNEFRYFDTKSLKQTTARIEDIIIQPQYREIFLRNDHERRTRRYIFEQDINGRFYIQNDLDLDQHLESDYAKVNFTLSAPSTIPNGNVYLSGEFTNWNYDKSNLMRYNYEKEAYHISLLLKQGYYNYMYMFLEDGKNKADISMIEGNYSDAENEYTVLVYYKRSGGLYDKLIGVKHLNTHNDER